MKTNKMLPDSSISKVWENFRKMKGVVISLLVSDWVAAENGTFTNTIYYDGFTSDEILEIDLYNDGNLTETHISEYDGYITEFDIIDGALVVTATTKPTVDIDVICRGAIVGEKVIINGSGSGGGDSIKIRKMKQADYDKLPVEEQKSGHYIITDAPGLTAKTLEYDDSETQFGVNNVQDAIVEQNKKLDWNLHASNVVGGSTIELPEIWTELMVYLHNTQTMYVTEHHILKTYFDTFEPGLFNLASGYYYTTSEGSVLNFVTKKGENSIKCSFTHCGGNVNSSGLVTVFYK